MRFLLALALLALSFARAARAELSEVTVAAVVKAFDDATVTVQIHRKELRVPRAQVRQGDLRIGTAIFVTFRGEQVNDLFKGLALNQAGRQPASKSSRHR